MRSVPVYALVLVTLAACSRAPENAGVGTTPASAAAPAAVPVADSASAPTAAAAKPPVSATKPHRVAAASKPTHYSTSTSQSAGTGGSTMAAAAPLPQCVNCGEVIAITPIKVEGKATGGGAVAGGIAGIIVGNQIGDGNGKTLAKIAGAVGGAYAGNKIEKKARAQTHYEVTVKLENGATSTVTLEQEPAMSVGARVRVIDGGIVAR